MNTDLRDYTLHLADNALILGHRNSEWCGHGPALEQDIAISNIALDGVGQARNFYQYAAAIMDNNSTEDSLAYLRDAVDFKNCLLVEQPNNDWAHTILRQFFVSTFQYYQYTSLQTGNDEQLAAIAEKALKEVTYHVRWSSEWVIRLGDGTEESRRRMIIAIETLWPFTAEMFSTTDYEAAAAKSGFGVDPATLFESWFSNIQRVFTQATLPVPAQTISRASGKIGNHTEHLQSILDEMQLLARTYPGAEW